MIVSDAGPIIIFARIRRLNLLQAVTGSLIIPTAVYQEIVLAKGGMPGADEVARSRWIRRSRVRDLSILDRLPPGLHAGEREAIALAQELDAQLLIDETRARRAAREAGIEVIGTLRILAEAKRLRHLPSLRSIVAQMQANSYRFDRGLIEAFLREMGES